MKEFVEQLHMTETRKSILATAVSLIKTWRRRSIQRRALANLSDHLLKDMGINRYDADFETSKPFWKA